MCSVGFVSVHSRAENLKRHFEMKHHKTQKIWVSEEIVNFLDVGSYQLDTMGGDATTIINVSIPPEMFFCV